MNLHKLAVMTAVISLCTIVHIFGLDRAAVVPFGAGDGVNPLVAAAIGETFALEMSKTGSFMVISQNDVYQQIESLSLQNAGSINDETAVKIGNAVKADLIYIGTVITTDSGATLNISVKCIDGKSGLASYTKTGVTENEASGVKSVCRLLAMQIAKGNFAPSLEQEKLTKEEQRIHERLKNNGHLDWTNRDAVRASFKANLNAGIVLAVVGGFFILPLPFCAIPFHNAIAIWRVYRKTNGETLYSFLSRININGNWNWKDKEVCVAFAIKL